MTIKRGNQLIRNATVSDASLLCRWWRDGKIMAHAGFPNGLNITEDEIIEKLSRDSDDTYRRLIIEVDGESVGEMSCHNKGEFTSEIGIKICDFEKREKGLGTNFLKMLIEYLFLESGYKKIILDTNVKNTRAQHVYNKLGFREVRVRIDDWKDQLGNLQSSIDYELTRTDYFKLVMSSPTRDDQDEINKLIEIVLNDNWVKNGLAEFEDGLIEEIQVKKAYLENFLSNGPDARTFIMAKLHGEIVGIAEFGPVNEIIESCGDETLNRLQEVGTVFVLPKYHRLGFGTKLMNAISERLVEIGETEFCIDSGYKTAIPIWTHKYGEPVYLLKDYWGPGGDHMVWKATIKK